MARRDRVVRGRVIVGVVGPIVPPGPAQVVDALYQLVLDGRDPQLAYGFADDGKNWSNNNRALAEWCAEMVVSIPHAAGEPVLAMAARQQWRVDSEHPVRFVLSGDYVIQVADQALGDGVEFLRRMSDVLAISTGAVTLPPLASEQPLYPILAVLRATSSGSRRRSVMPAGSVSSGHSGHAGHAGHGGHGGHADRSGRGGQTRSPWHPDVLTAAASAPRSTLQVVQGWARARDESLTVTAVLSAVLRRSLGAAGISLDRDAAVVIDLRRFLDPARRAVRGNFFSTVNLRVADPGNPGQLARAMRGALESGSAVRALLRTLVRRELFGSPATYPREVSAQPQARLVVTNLGDSGALTGLRWKAPAEERLCACLIRPDRPEDISLVVLGSADALHVSASFHGTTFAPERVQRALDEALRDPVALLNNKHISSNKSLGIAPDAPR
jgi:hypothetical protein